MPRRQRGSADLFVFRDSPHGPPTANRQPPTANRQPPPTANRQPLKSRRSGNFFVWAKFCSPAPPAQDSLVLPLVSTIPRVADRPRVFPVASTHRNAGAAWLSLASTSAHRRRTALTLRCPDPRHPSAAVLWAPKALLRYALPCHSPPLGSGWRLRRRPRPVRDGPASPEGGGGASPPLGPGLWEKMKFPKGNIDLGCFWYTLLCALQRPPPPLQGAQPIAQPLSP